MTKTYIKKQYLYLALIAVATTFSTFSYASDEVVDILPPVTEASNTDQELSVGVETHSAIRITPDKSELIRLDENASSIIIGNPAHVNIIADSAKTLVVIPRLPGATYFTVLGKNGQIIMQRHVIVASPKKDYVRIKRICADDAKNCQNTSVFYCPDMCHEIILGGSEESGSIDASSSDGNDGSPDIGVLDETE